MSKKTVTDEQIIAALLTNGTLRAAAVALDISERTLYDRMNDGEFKALYKAAKADLLRTAVNGLNSQMQTAIETVVEVMQDSQNNAAVRLQAAQTILNNADKFMQRLAVAEGKVSAQIESNKYEW